tara:strand:+ start:1668 stop:2216 length:549 start_codon:yes stop_codon:yes gene_type:complete
MKQLNKETIEKLHKRIPEDVISFASLHIDSNYRNAIFSFKGSVLSNIFIWIKDVSGDKFVLRYSYPELEFTHIHWTKNINFLGLIDYRYNKNLVLDAEYEFFKGEMQNPDNLFAIKTKEYDADGKPTILNEGYKLSEELSPINIDCISPYIENLVDSYFHFYKTKDTSARYIVWEECEECKK